MSVIAAPDSFHAAGALTLATTRPRTRSDKWGAGCLHLFQNVCALLRSIKSAKSS